MMRTAHIFRCYLVAGPTYMNDSHGGGEMERSHWHPAKGKKIGPTLHPNPSIFGSQTLMFLDIGFLIQWWITVRWMSNFIEHQFYAGKGWRHGLSNPNLEGLHLMVPITHIVSSIINIHIYGTIRESSVFTLILPIKSKTAKWMVDWFQSSIFSATH